MAKKIVPMQNKTFPYLSAHQPSPPPLNLKWTYKIDQKSGTEDQSKIRWEFRQEFSLKIKRKRNKNRF